MGAKTNPEEQFVLVAIKGAHHEPVKEGAIGIIQTERTKLKKSGNWRGWVFQVRRPDAYKALPILPPKRKKKKDWRAAANRGSWFGAKHEE